MSLPNIGITGKFRSGKNAVADYLTEKYGYMQFAFGDELKRYAHELFNVDASAKPRELYQWFGQTMRERDPDIWVRKCFDYIEHRRGVIPRRERSMAAYFDAPWFDVPWNAHARTQFRVVITDLRQPNEYDRCRAEGYVIIRVTCPDDIRIERARAAGDSFTDEDLRHETEQHVDTFAVDVEIDNNGSLDELYAQVDEVMAEISGGNGGAAA